jgi:hypothetical protein
VKIAKKSSSFTSSVLRENSDHKRLQSVEFDAGYCSEMRAFEHNAQAGAIISPFIDAT